MIHIDKIQQDRYAVIVENNEIDLNAAAVLTNNTIHPIKDGIYIKSKDYWYYTEDNTENRKIYRDSNYIIINISEISFSKQLIN